MSALFVCVFDELLNTGKKMGKVRYLLIFVFVVAVLFSLFKVVLSNDEDDRAANVVLQPFVDEAFSTFLSIECQTTYIVVYLNENILDEKVAEIQSDCTIVYRLNNNFVFNVSLVDRCRDVRKFYSTENSILHAFQVPAKYLTVEQATNEDLFAYCFESTVENSRTSSSTGRTLITTISFFMSHHALQPFTNVLKRVGLTEQIYFEIVDHFDTPPNIQNYPLNCWITSNISSDAIPTIKKTFLKNGCQLSPDVSLFHRYGTNHVRVGLSLMPFVKETRKFLYIQCQYIKCSSISMTTEEYPWCPNVERCREQSEFLYDDKLLHTASSETVLVTIPKEPQPVHLPSVHDFRNVKVEEQNLPINPDDNECGCDKPHQESSTVNDGRVPLPIAGAVAFASFAVGLLLMSGLCWIGTQQHTSNRRSSDLRSKTASQPAVKFMAPLQTTMNTSSSIVSLSTYSSPNVIISNADESKPQNPV